MTITPITDNVFSIFAPNPESYADAEEMINSILGTEVCFLVLLNYELMFFLLC